MPKVPSAKKTLHNHKDGVITIDLPVVSRWDLRKRAPMLRDDKSGFSELARLVESWRIDPVLFVMDMFGTNPTTQQEEILKTAGPEGSHVAVKSGHGTGKGSTVNYKSSMIDTPDGKKMWGDLKVGDFIFGADGYPTEIIATNYRGVLPVYRVTFDDGCSMLCDGDHLWNIRGRNSRCTNKMDWETVSTDEIMKRGVNRSNGCSKQLEIPIQGVVQYKERPVSIAPYLCGLWLGSGFPKNPKICIADDCSESILKIEELDYSVSVYNRNNRKCKIVHVLKSINSFRSIECFGRLSHERFVPDNYKYNTPEIRLEVLRGLLDTDGTVGKSGSISFSSTSMQLVRDVIWLVRSFGGKATMNNAVKHGWYYNKNRERVQCRDCWRCTIQMPEEYPPFYVKKKLEKIKKVKRRYLTRCIKNIEYEKDDEVMCITVANKDGLYLANDFIVTHNSTVFAWLTIWGLVCFNDVKVGCTAPTSHQLQDVLWPEIRKWKDKMLEPWRSDIEVTADKVTVKSTGCFAVARTARKDNPDAMQGLHSKTMMFLIDEASGVPDVVFEVAQGTLSTPGARVIMAGNPTKTTGYFHRAFNIARDYWTRMTLNCESSPLVSKEYIDQMKTEYGEESDIYRVRVLGEFPMGGDLQFIGLGVVEQAMQRRVVESAYKFAPVLLGVDVAWYGGDQSVIFMRQGTYSDIVWTGKNVDPTTLSGIVASYEDKLNASAVFIDRVGIGAGVVSNLLSLGRTPIGVDFGSSSTKPQYLNKRAECWANMKEWLTTGDGSIPSDERLKNDLTGVEYQFNMTGKLQLERKEVMRKRGLSSPDCFVAGTLIATPSGNRPIEQLKVGDEVITPIGTSKIIKVWENYTDKLATVGFSNGNQLCGKVNHDALTLTNGWRKLKELDGSDVIETSSLWRLMSWRMLNQLFTRESGSEFKHQVGTINQGKRIRQRDFFIGASGLTTMEIFLKGMLSITKTVTGAITGLKIWNSCRRLSTNQCTCEINSKIKNIERKIEKILIPQESLRANGMGQKAVFSGTKNMVKKHGRTEKRHKPSVQCAEEHSMHISRKEQDSAVIHANKGMAMIDTRQQQEYANTVERGSFLTSIGVKNVVPVSVQIDIVESRKVYNLTLDHENVYYANGILVSNCADALAMTFAYPIKPISKQFIDMELALNGDALYNPFEFKGSLLT